MNCLKNWNPFPWMEGSIICNCDECQRERLKMNIDHSRKYGFVIGLLRGILISASPTFGDFYKIPSEVIDKVRIEFEILENENDN